MPRSQNFVIHEEPCGTVEELKASSLPLSQYGSCHEPIVRADGKVDILGCFNWYDCKKSECPEKGESGEAGGPRNKCLRIIQKLSSGKTASRHIPVPCFHITEMREAHEGRGTKENPVLVQVVASEGDTIKLPGTINDDKTIPGEGLRRYAKPHIHDWKIEAFPRPKNNPQLAEEAFNAELMRQVQDEEQAQLVASLGVAQPKKRDK